MVFVDYRYFISLGHWLRNLGVSCLVNNRYQPTTAWILDEVVLLTDFHLIMGTFSTIELRQVLLFVRLLQYWLLAMHCLSWGALLSLWHWRLQLVAAVSVGCIRTLIQLLMLR